MRTKSKLLMFTAPLVLATLACTCGLTQQLGNLASNQAQQLAEGAQATAEAMAVESMATMAAQTAAEAGTGGEGGGDSGGDTGDDGSVDLGGITIGGDPSNSPFPVPDDPSVTVGAQSDTMISYIIEMNADDLLAYYRDELSARGYTEREDQTVSGMGITSMVFDGDPSGQPLTLQLADLGNGESSATVWLGDQ